MSPGAVSRQVKLLEGYFNAQLFLRTQQGLELTEKGRAYHLSVSAAFDQIDVASEALLGQRSKSAIRINAYTTFVSDWLMSRLPAFWSAHPDVNISIDASLEFVTVKSHDFDVVITAHSSESEGQYNLPLFTSRYFPACSPDYLAKNGPITSPSDIKNHRLLFSKIQRRNWKKWLEFVGEPEVALEYGISFENSSLAYKAARDGMGIVMGQHIFLADDLSSGTLVDIFKSPMPSSNSYYFTCKKSRKNSPEIRALRDWLRTELDKTESSILTRIGA